MLTKGDAGPGTVVAVADEIPAILRQLRVSSGLSQRELASRVGTKPSVICRLEKPTYRGHSLEMLRRVGSALGVEIAVQFASRAGPLRDEVG
jgi:transcriptional regulator with XRE-family HTH domain